MRYFDKQIIMAFLVAPLSFAILMTIVSIVTENTQDTVAVLKALSIITYPIAFVIGVPVYVLFQRFRINGLPSYLLTGALLSLMLIGYIIIYSQVPQILQYQDREFWRFPQIGWSFLFLFLSLLSVYVFWKIARPDKLTERKQ